MDESEKTSGTLLLTSLEDLVYLWITDRKWVWLKILKSQGKPQFFSSLVPYTKVPFGCGSNKCT